MVPSAKLKALGLAFAYRNRTYIITERKITAFEWSQFQSNWHNGWDIDLEEKWAKFLNPNSLRQLRTNVYEITSFEKMYFPAFEWNQFQIHTPNIWDALLGNVSRTDQQMCKISLWMPSWWLSKAQLTCHRLWTRYAPQSVSKRF